MTAMEDNLEVHFCDLCSASVPQRDVEAGIAARLGDKVIGACCLRQLRGPAESKARVEVAPAAASRGTGSLATVVVTLAAVAGAAMFLDWRLTEELTGLTTRLESVATLADEQAERLPAIETRLAELPAATAFRGVEARFEEASEQRDGFAAGLTRSVDGMRERLTALSAQVDQVRDAQREQGADGRTITAELRALGRDLAVVLARTEAAVRTEPVAVAPVGKPAEPPAGTAALPAGVAAEVERLTDPDPGTRFEAVDKLIQSAHPATLEPLLGCATDADLFVRRLTIEGLRHFRQPPAVEALIAALSDDERIVRHAAFESLRKLTGADIEYDAEARVDQRRNAIRRWQQWWDTHRADFES
ncbi:MAG: HEAT repeat domain-containing protein [Planctomycetota bacterium]